MHFPPSPPPLFPSFQSSSPSPPPLFPSFLSFSSPPLHSPSSPPPHPSPLLPITLPSPPLGFPSLPEARLSCLRAPPGPPLPSSWVIRQAVNNQPKEKDKALRQAPATRGLLRRCWAWCFFCSCFFFPCSCFCSCSASSSSSCWCLCWCFCCVYKGIDLKVKRGIYFCTFIEATQWKENQSNKSPTKSCFLYLTCISYICILLISWPLSFW